MSVADERVEAAEPAGSDRKVAPGGRVSGWRQLRRNEAFSVTAVYLLAGVAWIVGSDHLLKPLAAGDPNRWYALQQAKGLLFVGFTSLLLAWLLQRLRRRRIRREAELRQLEEMLSVAQKFEALGTLAGTITHDFNNMLTVIRMTAGAANGEQEPEPLRQSLGQIEQAAISAQQSVQQLVLFMHNAAVERRPRDLGALVCGSRELLQQAVGRHVALTVTCEDNLPPIVCDQAQVEQALVNLVTNARDALEGQDRKEIALRVQQVRLHRYRTPFSQTRRTGCYVYVAVEDNGPGIPAAQRVRVFAPFYTTKPKGQGTGLGLASVWRIMEQHQGWVELASSHRGGAAFLLYFPTEELRPASP